MRPALLSPQLCTFQDWMKGNGPLETEGYNPIKIKLSTTAHPSVRASRHSYSSGTPRAPLPLATEKDHPHISLLTVGHPGVYLSHEAWRWVQLAGAPSQPLRAWIVPTCSLHEQQLQKMVEGIAGHPGVSSHLLKCGRAWRLVF